MSVLNHPVPVSDTSPSAQAQVLDPRTLGRPMHLLAALSARFGSDVAELLRLGPNRRYGTGLAVEYATMQRQRPDAVESVVQRWNVYAGDAGRIGLAMPRTLVLRLLQCRYDLQDAPAAELGGAVTASEERLSHKLGLQLAQALARRIEQGLPPPGAAAPEGPAPSLAFQAEVAQPTGLWQIELVLFEAEHGSRHLLRLSLDDAWMHRLLDRLGQARTLPRDQATANGLPLASRLKLRLVARLVQQRLPLGAILDLQPGSVLPIPQPATVVLVKDSPLFSASVAEHKGRLWLTAFQDL